MVVNIKSIFNWAWEHFYFFDFICMIICYVLNCKSMQIPVTPQKISTPNPIYDFPQQNQTIPRNVLSNFTTYYALIYILLLFILSLFLKPHFKSFEIFSALWSLLIAVHLGTFTANVFKSLVGRPRPDMYSYCGFNATYQTCKYKKKDKEFISWPSNHAASAMSCSVFLALFSQKVFHMKFLFFSLISYSFIFLGIWIGATRIKDNKHHPDDVTAGFLIGAITALFIWIKAQKTIFPKQFKTKIVQYSTGDDGFEIDNENS